MILVSKRAVNMLGVSYSGYNNLSPANVCCKYCVAKLVQQLNVPSSRFLSSYSSHADYYAILGVAKSASADEIKAAFVKQSKMLHPDKNPSHKSHSQFVKLNEAYSTLKSADSRKQYDMQMGFGAGGGAPYGGYHNPTAPSGPLYYEYYNSQTGQMEWSSYRRSPRREEEYFRQNFDRRATKQWGGFTVDDDINRGGSSDFSRHIVSTYLTMFLLLFVLTIVGSSFATRSNRYRQLDYDRLMLLEAQSRYADMDVNETSRRHQRQQTSSRMATGTPEHTNIDSNTR